MLLYQIAAGRGGGQVEVYVRVFLFPPLGKEIRETKYEEVAAEGSVGTDQREIHYPVVTGHIYRM